MIDYKEWDNTTNPFVIIVSGLNLLFGKCYSDSEFDFAYSFENICLFSKSLFFV